MRWIYVNTHIHIYKSIADLPFKHWEAAQVVSDPEYG